MEAFRFPAVDKGGRLGSLPLPTLNADTRSRTVHMAHAEPLAGSEEALAAVPLDLAWQRRPFLRPPPGSRHALFGRSTTPASCTRTFVRSF